MDFVACMVWPIGVFIVHQFRGVSDAVKMVTTNGTVVRGSQGCVSFALSHAMLRLIVHRE